MRHPRSKLSELVSYEIIWNGLSMAEVSTTKMKYWTHGIQYKFSLLDRTKIRIFGIFAINFYWNIKIRSYLQNWKEVTSGYHKLNFHIWRS